MCYRYVIFNQYLEITWNSFEFELNFLRKMNISVLLQFIYFKIKVLYFPINERNM